jgi:hypothetical protein
MQPGVQPREQARARHHVAAWPRHIELGCQQLWARCGRCRAVRDLQGRKIGWQVRADELVDRFGVWQILELMGAKVAQRGAGGQLVAHELRGRRGKQHLATVARRQQARRAVERRAEVIAVGWLGSARVDGHARAKRYTWR